MKINQFKISAMFIILITGFLVFMACEKKDEEFPRTRLFSPVLNEDLFSIDNTIIVNLGKMKDAVSYTIEISRDTFNTIDYTIESDSNYVIVDKELIGEELLWYTLYQVRATAHADDPEYDSKVSDLGSIRTQKFPSNMGTPTSFDVLDTKARVFWTPAGAAITAVKVFDIGDLRLETPLLESAVTVEEQQAAEKIVYGLSPSTTYQIAIFSGDDIRGWEIYTTREAFITGDNVIDLTGIESTSVLADTLPAIPDGSIILLEGGRNYTTGGYSFDKSIVIRSGYSFTPALPHIDCGSNFNIVDGSTVDSVVFIDISFSADFAANYVFNIDKSGTIGEIRFESCRIRSLRGITRFKGGTGTLSKFSIINTVADSINGYALLTVDVAEWTAEDILLKNSTFSKCQYFLASRSNSNSVTITDCTISEAPENGRPMFRWRGTPESNVLNGIKIYNTIWGHGWDYTAGGVLAVRGIEGLSLTNFEIINTYATSDFSFSGDAIPGFPALQYSGTAADLWVDPYNAVDFNFKDTGFSGKSDSGDPRWRPF
jgi:hypothetical protein